MMKSRGERNRQLQKKKKECGTLKTASFARIQAVVTKKEFTPTLLTQKKPVPQEGRTCRRMTNEVIILSKDENAHSNTKRNGEHEKKRHPWVNGGCEADERRERHSRIQKRNPP